MTTVKLTKEQLKNGLDRLTFNIVNDLVSALIRRAPVDKGFLRNHIRFEKRGDNYIILMPDYAKFVEFGTPPHIIRPKNKKALRFEVGRKARLVAKGKDPNIVFTKEVKHPGTRPQPFIRPAIREDLPKIVSDNVRRMQS